MFPYNGFKTHKRFSKLGFMFTDSASLFGNTSPETRQPRAVPTINIIPPVIEQIAPVPMPVVEEEVPMPVVEEEVSMPVVEEVPMSVVEEVSMPVVEEVPMSVVEEFSKPISSNKNNMRVSSRVKLSHKLQSNRNLQV